jgi:hypothetical protein
MIGLDCNILVQLASGRDPGNREAPRAVIVVANSSPLITLARVVFI